MEDEEVEDIYFYLCCKIIPDRLRGVEKREKLKTWKKKLRSMKIVQRDENQMLSLKNSCLLQKRKGKRVICVRKSQLEEVWKKFHEEKGHPGKNSSGWRKRS
jgi:hypothetical protein